MSESGTAAASGTHAVDRAADLVSTVVRADEPLSLRRPPGGERPGQVDDLADAQRPRALRPARARRRRVVRRRLAVLAVRRPPRPVGRDWSGSPGRPWRRSARTPRETVHLSVTRGERVVQVAQVDSRYLLGTRDWTEIDVPAHCSALGKVFFAWGALPIPDAPLERLTDATITDPDAAAPRRRPRPQARLGGHRRRARGRPHRHRRTRPRHPRRRGRGPRHLGTHRPTGGPARRARSPPARTTRRSCPRLLRGTSTSKEGVA